MESLLRLSAATIHLDQGRVLREDGSLLALSTREVALLRYLAARPGVEVSRETLLTEVWGYAGAVVSRAVDNTVARLRARIEADPAEPRHLLTAHGAGYRLDLGAAPTPVVVSERAAPALKLGAAVVHLGAMSIERGGERRPLSALEAALLEALASDPGRPWSRAELGRRLYGRADPDSRALDALVFRLRASLEEDPAEPRFLRTVRGKGYQLVLEPGAEAGALAVAALEDEARWWRRHPEAATEALHAAHSLLARLATLRGGKTWESPDSRFRASFPSVDEALRWAGEAQARLLELPWPAPLLDEPALAPVRDAEGRLIYRGPRVAMAVHVASGPLPEARWWGAEAVELEPMLARAAGGAARVSKAALQRASAEVWGELAVQGDDDGDPPDTVVVVPRGLGGRLHRGAAQAELEPMIGRDELYEAAQAALRQARAIVLRGPGGVGKTRLARALLSGLSRSLPGGGRWCDLSESVDRDTALLALQRALDLPGEGDALPRIGRALAFRGASLLVLDNAEQVAEVAGEFGRVLLAAAPELLLVITSREPVAVGQDLPVPPLSLADAEALFLARARRAAGAFVLPPEQLPVLRALLQRLDRLPLAIGLAAGWMGLSTVPELLDHLERAGALEGPGQGRHASLRTAIAWSWRRLSPWEVHGLQALSCFPGGFSLEAAEEVLDLADRWPDAPEPRPLLRRLVDRSLVAVEPAEDGPRYRLYEAVRACARERLDAETRAELERGLVLYCAQFGLPSARRALFQRGQEARRARVRAERVNLDAACQLAIEAGQPCGGLALLLGELYRREGPCARGLELVRAANALEPDPVLRAELGLQEGRLLKEIDRPLEALPVLGEVFHFASERALPAAARDAAGLLSVSNMNATRRAEALTWARVWLSLCAAAPDPAVEAMARAWLVRVDPSLAPAEGLRVLEQSLVAVLASGDLIRELAIRWHLGRVAIYQGRLSQARAVLLEGIEVARQVGSPLEAVYLLRLLALALELLGEEDELTRRLQEGVALAGSLGQSGDEGLMRTRLGALRVRQGDLAAAERAFAAARRALAELPHTLNALYLEQQMAWYHLAWRDAKSAEAAVSLAVAGYRRLGNQGNLVEALAVAATVALARGDLRAAEAFVTEGLATGGEGALPEPQVEIRCAAGRLALARGEGAEAARHLAEARRLAEEAGFGALSPPGRRIRGLAEALGVQETFAQDHASVLG